MGCTYPAAVEQNSSANVDDGGSATAPYYYVYGYEGTDVADAQATANYDTYGVLYNLALGLYFELFQRNKIIRKYTLRREVNFIYLLDIVS